MANTLIKVIGCRVLKENHYQGQSVGLTGVRFGALVSRQWEAPAVRGSQESQ